MKEYIIAFSIFFVVGALIVHLNNRIDNCPGVLVKGVIGLVCIDAQEIK